MKEISPNDLLIEHIGEDEQSHSKAQEDIAKQDPKQHHKDG